MSAWTNKTPTESGWYWWRKDKRNKYHEPFKITKHDDVLYIANAAKLSTLQGFLKINGTSKSQWHKVPEPKD